MKAACSGPPDLNLGVTERQRRATDQRMKKRNLKNRYETYHDKTYLPGSIAQSVMCMATEVFLTAYPGVASSMPAQSHTFMEIDREIISTVILLPSAESFKKDCCQLQAKVCAQSTG